MRVLFPVGVLGVLLAAIMLTTQRPSLPLHPASATALAGLAGMTLAQTDVPPSPIPAPPTPAYAPAPPGQRPYVPILMYHYVRTVDANLDPLGYDLSVTHDQLAAQLAWLQSQGYATITVSTLAACMRGEVPCPAHAVALTFDDGHLDAYTDALPLLQQYGAVATFYIVRGFVGQEAYMGWDEIRALAQAGMEIGAHSISHLDLTTLSYYEQVDQIARAGQEIAAEVGVPVRSFCYPAGRFNPDIATITRDAGYTSATTTIQEGPQDDPYTLPRLRIYGAMDLDGFAATVGAYR
ncbi:polysaccharide deacetylase [Oscillochloris trichoides DG-6]|uniref:Polysaccharide deacetylase n=1 Tax=Oscillochloris trichoides DG-6 TaxID=765420 RepID=E1IIS3_9CHLR|nr:polysaccharide deacetylase family protein [Oscillochloris trichoides]EFO78929.1 polysaccharide deacetylase [Oscillochloris trichoides DG-6]